MFRNTVLAFSMAVLAAPAFAQQGEAWPSDTSAWSALIEIAGPPRDTRAARREAADALVSVAAEAGLTVQRRAYAYPNEFPVLDLLIGPFRGENLLIEIPATTPSRAVIVLGAHFDTDLGSPGADDNASGVAALLSLAVDFQALDHRGHNLLIVFFDQEEEGAIGSRALVRQLMRDGTAIQSMHNLDMIAWDSDGDRTLELDAADDRWFDLYERAARPLGLRLDRTVYDSTDHVAFREAGFPANCLSEAFRRGDYSPHYHTPDDTIEQLEPVIIDDARALMASVIRSLLAEGE